MMRTRERWRLTPAEWAALKEDERDTLMAWERYREHERREQLGVLTTWRERLIEEEAFTPEAATMILLARLTNG